MSKIDLKPCPFCGSAAEKDYMQSYRAISGGRLDHGAAIYCTGCNAYMMVCRADMPELSDEERMAILEENWNRRAAFAPTGLKPLDWVLCEDGATYHAQTVFGRWAYWEGHFLPPDGYGGIKADDPRTAAQSEYETRIMSAFAPAGAGDDLTNRQKEMVLLHVIADMGGEVESSDSPHSWLNWFCSDEVHGKHSDTFNRCIEHGWLNSTHNTDFDISTTWLTPAGRAAILDHIAAKYAEGPTDA